MTGMWILTVRGSFSAAHALRHYKGKCEQLHGHNYTVSVEISGTKTQPDTEIVMDFHDLKQILKTAVTPLDHANLNTIPPFDVINPSSENLARFVWDRIRPLIPQPLHLLSVTVGETPEQSATYKETDGEN